MKNQTSRAVVAYVFTLIGGLIILLGFKDNTRNTRIHAAQSITMALIYYIVVALGSIILPSFIVYFFSILYFAVMIIGIVKAAKDEDPEIPVLADMAKSIFAAQINKEDNTSTNNTADTANTSSTTDTTTTTDTTETDNVINTENTDNSNNTDESN